MHKIIDYFRLVKFEHTIFALPFALIGFVLAYQLGEYQLSYLLLLKVLLCMVFARNAAMGFNRLIDYKIDAANPRTEDREIPSGKLKPIHVAFFVLINSLAFIAVTYFINPLCFYLSFFALFVLLAYSVTKRFTSYSHFVLGFDLAIAPTAAYMSVTGEFSWVTALFSLMVLLWVTGFDILYSLPDESFDRKTGLHSIPQKFGRVKAMRISFWLHVSVAPILVVIYFVGNMGNLYLIGANIFVLLLVRQHRIISPTDLKRLNAAFFTTNGIASVLFAIFTIADILLRLSNA